MARVIAGMTISVDGFVAIRAARSTVSTPTYEMGEPDSYVSIWFRILHPPT
jgi:hypothetical protein